MESPKWWFQFTLEIAVLIVGLTGNIFVLIIVHKRNARTTIHEIFVTSLAIADLVLLCFDSPVSILRRFSLKSETYNCSVHLTVVTTGYNAGLLTITSMAIHRCHIVTNPWRPKLKRSVAVAWVILLWLAAFILVIPLITVSKIADNGKCEKDWNSLSHRQAYTASLLTAQYILPLLITAICYLRIWLFMRNRPVLAGKSNLTNNRQIPREDKIRESMTILKTVAVIVLLFSILLLPNQVAWMLLDFRKVSYEDLWFVADILTRLHSCTNPVVYGVMNTQYRRNYITFLSRMFCCRRFRRVAQAFPDRTVGERQAACVAEAFPDRTVGERQAARVAQAFPDRTVGERQAARVAQAFPDRTVGERQAARVAQAFPDRTVGERQAACIESLEQNISENNHADNGSNREL